MPTPEQVRAAVDAHFRLWNAGDREGWIANFAEDVVFHDPRRRPAQARATGGRAQLGQRLHQRPAVDAAAHEDHRLRRRGRGDAREPRRGQRPDVRHGGHRDLEGRRRRPGLHGAGLLRRPGGRAARRVLHATTRRQHHDDADAATVAPASAGVVVTVAWSRPGVHRRPRATPTTTPEPTVGLPTRSHRGSEHHGGGPATGRAPGDVGHGEPVAGEHPGEARLAVDPLTRRFLPLPFFAFRAGSAGTSRARRGTPRARGGRGAGTAGSGTGGGVGAGPGSDRGAGASSRSRSSSSVSERRTSVRRARRG